MAVSQKVKVAFYVSASLLKNKTIQSYMKANWDPYFRLLLIISQGMNFSYEAIPYASGGEFINGSWTGAVGMLNRSEVDMSTDLFSVNDERLEGMHFCYPYRLYAFTFVVAKPEYSPEIFGLLKAFSPSLWLTIALFAIALVVFKFIIMKDKYSLEDVLLHVISDFLRQSTLLKPWTMSQNILMCNWTIGAMILGFCYTSVLLSFLTFPTISQIRDLRDLIRAVENDGYKCMFNSYWSRAPTAFATSKVETVVRIGEHLLSNPNRFGTWEDFFRMHKEKIAFFDILEGVPSLPDGYYASDDSLFEKGNAMVVRKDFCCKKEVDMMIHRIMAAGLYSKVIRDKVFFSSLKYSFAMTKIVSERKLSLKDLFLPFMILIIGYALSVGVLIGEIILGSRVKEAKRKRRRKKNYG